MSQLVRDKIEAVARLWYASEPDKGLRERLTEGLIDKMTAAVLPALAEASQRSEGRTLRDEVLDEVKAMLEEQRNECLQTNDIRNTGYNRLRADELDNALINLRALRSQRSETGTSDELKQALRNAIYDRCGGAISSWHTVDGVLVNVMSVLDSYKARQAGSETPAPCLDLAGALERLEAKWRALAANLKALERELECQWPEQCADELKRTLTEVQR